VASTGGVLLCTDVAARGLDISDVDYVIQYGRPRACASAAGGTCFCLLSCRMGDAFDGCFVVAVVVLVVGRPCARADVSMGGLGERLDMTHRRIRVGLCTASGGQRGWGAQATPCCFCCRPKRATPVRSPSHAHTHTYLCSHT
jgi:hypothetical protein